MRCVFCCPEVLLLMGGVWGGECQISLKYRKAAIWGNPREVVLNLIEFHVTSGFRALNFYSGHPLVQFLFERLLRAGKDVRFRRSTSKVLVEQFRIMFPAFSLNLSNVQFTCVLEFCRRFCNRSNMQIACSLWRVQRILNCPRAFRFLQRRENLTERC